MTKTRSLLLLSANNSPIHAFATRCESGSGGFRLLAQCVLVCKGLLFIRSSFHFLDSSVPSEGSRIKITHMPEKNHIFAD